MRITDLQVQHDDGNWYIATLRDQHRRPDGTWRVVVSYSTSPGFQYLRGMPADLCRPLPDQQHEEADDGRARGEQPDHRDAPRQ